MIPFFDKNSLMKSIQGEYRALWLFGSCARGDADLFSDIDVIQVSGKRAASYRVGRLAVSVYTLPHLFRMAWSGSLFVRHLIQEAVAIEDNNNLLGDLRVSFVEPESYLEYRRELMAASVLLSVSESEYRSRQERQWRLGCFIFRSYLYALLADDRQLVFSIKDVSCVLKDQRIEELLRSRQADYVRYQQLLHVLADYSGPIPICTAGSIEAEIVNAWGKRSLLVILGLRLLNSSDLLPEYEVLAEVVGGTEIL
jgi:predicted nucleotidyltransferase